MVAVKSWIILLATLLATSNATPFLPVADAGSINAVHRPHESGPPVDGIGNVQAMPPALDGTFVLVTSLPKPVSHSVSKEENAKKHPEKGEGKHHHRSVKEVETQDTKHRHSDHYDHGYDRRDEQTQASPDMYKHQDRHHHRRHLPGGVSKRSPYHLHEEVVVTGSNDIVHVHERSAGIEKQDNDNNPNFGVPGTVDIVNTNEGKRVASLVLYTVSNGTANRTFTKGSSKSKVITAPGETLLLYASNSTSTRFILVPTKQTTINDKLTGTAPDGMPKAAFFGGSSLAFDAFKSVKVLSSTKPHTVNGPTGKDTMNTNTNSGAIPVTVQFHVFDSEKAAMTPYCATYDKAPSKPAPLRMERCSNSGVGKSQSFAYTPDTGIIRMMWRKSSHFEMLSSTKSSATDLAPNRIKEEMRFTQSTSSGSGTEPSSALPIAHDVVLASAPAIPV